MPLKQSHGFDLICSMNFRTNDSWQITLFLEWNVNLNYMKKSRFPSAQNVVHSKFHLFTRPTDYSSVRSSVKLNLSCLYLCKYEIGSTKYRFLYGSSHQFHDTLTHTNEMCFVLCECVKCIIDSEARTIVAFSTQFIWLDNLLLAICFI